MNEQYLLSVARDFMEMNPGSCLTGSLMLHLRGIETRRPSKDIDILVTEMTDFPTPVGWVQTTPVYPDGVKFQIGEVLADVMLNQFDAVELIHGIPCASVEFTVAAKTRFALQGNDASEKHRLDLEFMGYQVPVVVDTDDNELPW